MASGGVATIKAQHLAVNLPGRMESHPGHRALACPYLTQGDLYPENVEQSMCEAIPGKGSHPCAHEDEEKFTLHLAYMRAHGAPKGEFTTFSSGSALIVQGKGIVRSYSQP